MKIGYDKSIIPSLDVSTIERMQEVVARTCRIDGIGAYKIGLELALRYGIPNIIAKIREITDLPVIYDHQKAATDIPDLGYKFMSACNGVDAVIIFPVMGPETLKAWVLAAKEAGMHLIVGGEMTHPGYLSSTGGYIRDTAPDEIYELAASLGIKDFVIPGNKPERIQHYRELLYDYKPIFYSPGLVTQGGEITESGRAAGQFWHAIVGRAIYDAVDMERSARKLVSSLH